MTGDIMKDERERTLKEVKALCLDAVEKADKHNKKNPKNTIGCEEICKFKCRQHNIGWYPGGWNLCDDDLMKIIIIKNT
jgi:hypothetical protein